MNAVVDPETLGWAADTIGELDHRRLKAPSVKLRGAHVGSHGDVVYTVDLRWRLPNAGVCMDSAALHSLEHFLLEGFGRLLPAHFIGVGVMGCRTGFYLTLLNEGRREVIEQTLEAVLRGVLTATAVPYANIGQCGHWRQHDLAAAQGVARGVLARRAAWREIA
ncbi:MAG: S-ribosylhomocysteine lyase [Rhodanobacter sp.]